MSEPITLEQPDALSANQPGTCESCGGPGDPVQTDQRGIVLLCATCFGAQLRRGMPWRRYLNVVAAALFIVPFLALFVGTGSDVIEALRTGTPPVVTRTMLETVAYGWGILTAVTDHWASLGVVTAVAIAVPVSLVPIATLGESIARQVKTSPIQSLDDHNRLLLLDSGLTITSSVGMLTTIVTFIMAIDALIDVEPGGAHRFLFCLTLAAILVVEVVKVGAFSNFAVGSRLLVKADLARSVRERRQRAHDLNFLQGAVAVAVTFTLLALPYLAATFPAGLAAVGGGLAFAVFGVSSSLLMAGMAALYLRDGGRPSGAFAVAIGIAVGIFWTANTLTETLDHHYELVNPWGALLGIGSVIPLYLLITLGLISTGPLKWLAFFTARLEDANTALDRAIRNRTRRPTRPGPTTQVTSETRQ